MKSIGWAAIAAVFGFVALGAWAVSSPVGSAPDDDFHLTSIWCAAGAQSDGTCRATGPAHGGEITVAAPERVAGAPCYAFQVEVTAVCQRSLPSGTVLARSNHGIYPPWFYRVMHLFVGSDIAASVLTMRLFNCALAVVLLAAAVAVTEGRLRGAVLLAWVTTLVPLTAFTIASTNPSSWAISGLGTCWAFLLQFLLGSPGRRRVAAGALALVSFGIACAARVDAPIYGVAIAASCGALAFIVARRAVLARLALPAVMIVIGVVLGLGGSATQVATNGLAAPAQSGHAFGLGALDLFHLPELFLGIFGAGWGLSWLDTPVPTETSTIVVAVLAVLLARSLSNIDWRRAAMLAPLVGALVVIPLYVLVISGNVVGENVQPRYLIPLLIPLIGISLSGLLTSGDSTPRLGLRGAVGAAVAIAVANGYALHALLIRFVHGGAAQILDPNRDEAWWWAHAWLSARDVWLGGGLSALLALVAAAVLISRAQPEVAASAASSPTP